MAELFPLTAVLWDATATEQQLATTHPEQFQKIDRSRAESDFKIAVAGPIIFAGVAICKGGGWTAAGLTLFAISGVLLYLALEDVRRANRYLWTAVYLDYASPPILNMAVEQLQTEPVKGELNLIHIGTISWVQKFLRNAGVDWQIQSDFDDNWINDLDSPG